MKLHEYVSSPDGVPPAKLVERLRRTRVGRRVSVVQLRQWIHGYDGRMPGAAYCVAIEAATDGQVTRRDLRPDDWHDIWPELAGPTHTAAPQCEARQEAAHV
jgi:DNA-binding transcriptional regulator YdaS (Cro superfamily)